MLRLGRRQEFWGLTESLWLLGPTTVAVECVGCLSLRNDRLAFCEFVANGDDIFREIASTDEAHTLQASAREGSTRDSHSPGTDKGEIEPAFEALYHDQNHVILLAPDSAVLLHMDLPSCRVLSKAKFEDLNGLPLGCIGTWLIVLNEEESLVLRNLVTGQVDNVRGSVCCQANNTHLISIDNQYVYVQTLFEAKKALPAGSAHPTGREAEGSVIIIQHFFDECQSLVALRSDGDRALILAWVTNAWTEPEEVETKFELFEIDYHEQSIKTFAATGDEPNLNPIEESEDLLDSMEGPNHPMRSRLMSAELAKDCFAIALNTGHCAVLLKVLGREFIIERWDCLTAQPSGDSFDEVYGISNLLVLQEAQASLLFLQTDGTLIDIEISACESLSYEDNDSGPLTQPAALMSVIAPDDINEKNLSTGGRSAFEAKDASSAEFAKAELARGKAPSPERVQLIGGLSKAVDELGKSSVGGQEVMKIAKSPGVTGREEIVGPERDRCGEILDQLESVPVGMMYEEGWLLFVSGLREYNKLVDGLCVERLELERDFERVRELDFNLKKKLKKNKNWKKKLDFEHLKNKINKMQKNYLEIQNLKSVDQTLSLSTNYQPDPTLRREMYAITCLQKILPKTLLDSCEQEALSHQAEKIVTLLNQVKLLKATIATQAPTNLLLNSTNQTAIVPLARRETHNTRTCSRYGLDDDFFGEENDEDEPPVTQCPLREHTPILAEAIAMSRLPSLHIQAKMLMDSLSNTFAQGRIYLEFAKDQRENVLKLDQPLEPAPALEDVKLTTRSAGASLGSFLETCEIAREELSNQLKRDFNFLKYQCP